MADTLDICAFFYASAFCLLCTAERLSFMLLPVISIKISLFYCFHLCFGSRFFHACTMVMFHWIFDLDCDACSCALAFAFLIIIIAHTVSIAREHVMWRDWRCSAAAGVIYKILLSALTKAAPRPHLLVPRLFCSRFITELSQAWSFFFVMHLWFMKKRPFIVNRLQIDDAQKPISAQ